MHNVLLWIGAIFMLLGLLTYILNCHIIFSSTGMFMFGATLNSVVIVLRSIVNDDSD